MALGSDHRSLCRLRRFSWYNETLYQKSRTLTAFRTVYPDIIGAYEKIRFSTKDLPESQFCMANKHPSHYLSLKMAFNLLPI